MISGDCKFKLNKISNKTSSVAENEKALTAMPVIALFDTLLHPSACVSYLVPLTDSICLQIAVAPCSVGRKCCYAINLCINKLVNP